VLFRTAVLAHIALLASARWLVGRLERKEEGQSTVEYALVLLGAAAVALLLVAWATKSNRVGKLLDLVFDQLTDRAEA
jgi:Flp pilus assembly pilin Flp